MVLCTRRCTRKKNFGCSFYGWSMGGARTQLASYNAQFTKQMHEVCCTIFYIFFLRLCGSLSAVKVGGKTPCFAAMSETEFVLNKKANFTYTIFRYVAEQLSLKAMAMRRGASDAGVARKNGHERHGGLRDGPCYFSSSKRFCAK